MTYTLSADCTQTGLLLIAPATPFTVTIEGMGYTINMPDNTRFMQVEPPASGRPLIAKNITLAGGGGTNGGLFHIMGNATLENVTFSETKYTAVLALAEDVILKNILFENIRGGYWRYNRQPAAIYADQNGTITATNVVLRHVTNGNAAVGASLGGTLTLKGCLTADGIFPRFFYAEPTRKGGDSVFGKGTVTNSSTGECRGAIGNGGTSAKKYLAPDPAACGLPKQGFLQASATYSLSADCQQTGTLYIREGLTVTINGNGRAINGGAFRSIDSAGNTTVRNVVFTGSSTSTAYPILTFLYNPLTIERSSFRGNKAPILIIDAVAHLNNLLFENNSQSGTAASHASALRILRAATVNLNNSVFRNNTGGNSAFFTGDSDRFSPTRPTAIVRLCRNTFSGNTPRDIHNPNTTTSENTNCVDDGTDPGAPPPSSPPSPRKPKSAAEESRSAGPPASTYENIPVGVIARLFRSGNGADTVIDVYGVDANSNGFYILSVTQKQVEAAVGETAIGVSADGRVLVLVWADGNVTFQVGPNAEGKILHTTFAGGLFGPIIGTTSTYGAAPGLPYLNAAAAPQVAAAQNCMITTTHALNLRAAAGGDIIGGVPYNVKLTVLARSPGWFQVDYHGVAGWLSADYVRESCA